MRKKSGVRKKKGRKGLWLLIFAVVLLGAFYFRRQITSTGSYYAKQVRAALATKTDRRAPEATGAKPRAAASVQGTFTFFPDKKDRFAWAVKYPDGRVFKLGQEFSSDCNPTLGRAKTPDTVRFEFSEQRSCNSALRNPVQVDAASMKTANGDSSPTIVAAILTGGNIYGHTSSLISLTPTGPKLLRRLE